MVKSAAWLFVALPVVALLWAAGLCMDASNAIVRLIEKLFSVPRR